MYIYYVYAYLREDGTPYYIGKGCNNRFKEKHNVSIPKDKSKIVFLETNLSNVGALALERRMIRWYGRKDNNTGILRNLTDGGDGACGSSNPCSSQKAAKISKSLTGLKQSSDTIQKRLNTRKSNNKKTVYDRSFCKDPDYRKRMSISCKKTIKTEEWNRKNSQSNKGRTHIANIITKERKRPKSEEALKLINESNGVWIPLATNKQIPDYSSSSL